MATDPLELAFVSLRVTGSVLVHESYATPFAIEIPAEAELRTMLGVGPTVRVLPFHLVWRGGLELAVSALKPRRVHERQVVICTNGAAHRIGLGRATRPISLERALAGGAPRRSAAREPLVECICGVFQIDALPLDPLWGAWPAVLQLPTREPAVLRLATEMLALELASGRRTSFTTSRLLEVFFAESLRASLAHARLGPSWVRGLADPKIGRAIARIHEAPAHAWTVAALARTAAISPSRFAARFRETTGQSAMRYVKRWRMHQACRALCASDEGVAQVAATVGYDDVAAFGRAFKALVGKSPARWRAEALRERGAHGRAVDRP